MLGGYRNRPTYESRWRLTSRCSAALGALLRKALLRGAAEVVGETPIVAFGNFFAHAAEAAAELRRGQ